MHDSKKNLDKKLLALNRERDSLWPLLWNITKLEIPIQHGWVRRHILSPKINERQNQVMLADILTVIGSEKWHRSRDFRRRPIKGGRKRMVEIEQPLNNIPAWRWDRQRYPEVWKFYFRLEAVRNYKSWQREYVFSYPDLFELQIEPFWATEFRVLNSEVDQRIKELDRWLTNHHLWPRLHWLLGNTRHWRDKSELRRVVERTALRELNKAYADFPEAEPNLSKRWIGSASGPMRRAPACATWSPKPGGSGAAPERRAMANR